MTSADMSIPQAGLHDRAKFILTILLSTALPFLLVPFAVDRTTTFSAAVILAFTVINSLHIGATFWFYIDPDFKAVRQAHPRSFYSVPAALLVGVPALYYALGPHKALLVVGFQAWANYHYGKQNLGLFSLISLAEKKPSMTPGEKKALVAASWGGALGAAYLFAQITGAASSAPAQVMSALFYVGLAVQAAAIVAAVAIMARNRDRYGPWKAVFLLSSVGFFISQYLFASPVMTVMVYAWAHGLQYVIMVGLMSRPRSERNWKLFGGAWLFILILPAAFIFLGGHTQWAFLPSQTWIDVLLAANIAMVMAHFVVDAVAWRLREAPQRNYVFSRLAFLFK